MYLRIYINILIFIIIIVQDTVLSGCIKNSINRVWCNETSNISQDYFNETIGSLNQIEQINIQFIHGNLEISRDSFTTALDVKRIRILYSKIDKLYGNTFKDLPNLDDIIIERDNINELDPSTFLNLTSLISISLTRNNLTLIKKETFKDLPVLVELKLSYNKISKIENQALENVPMLKSLDLDNNNLKTVFLQKILSHPEKLTRLLLHHNQLTFVSNYMLERLNNLTYLSLANNNITSIEEGSFEHTPKLFFLDLSFNQLKELNENVFPVKGLQSLEYFHFNNNQLMYLPFNFFNKANRLVGVSIVGNPWYCNCLKYITLVLHEKRIAEGCTIFYSNGQRPVCVVDRLENKTCSNVYDDKLSENYVTALKQYFLYYCV